ncbi:MAG: glycosyltransferase family 4 protein [Nitrospinaceae bacterium]
MGWGGQEIRIFQESRLLLERGHRVTVICQPRSPLAERCASLSDSRFDFHTIRMPGPLHPASFTTLYRLLKKIRPDLLHTHSSIDSWQVSPIGKLLGIPLVRSRHVCIPVKNFFPNNRLYSYFPSRIITSGEAIRDLLLRLSGMDPERVVSIPAGVDLRRFDLQISGQRIRKELGVEVGKPLIGKIGVIRGWKGFQYFVEAVPLVLRERPDARFVIVGTGPGYEEIKRKVRDQGLQDAVTLTGYREDVPEIIAALDVLVLASFAGEGTSQVIPQAFAMKTPVVATRGGSIPELFRNGDRGILADIRSGRSLAEGILKLLVDPARARRMAENAYAYCRKELTIGKMIDQTLAVYHEVLNSHGG